MKSPCRETWTVLGLGGPFVAPRLTAWVMGVSAEKKEKRVTASGFCSVDNIEERL